MKRMYNEKKKRLFSLFLVLLLGFSLLLFRFFYIQVIEENIWVKKAEGQHYFFIEEPFFRGNFYSTSVSKMHPEVIYPLTIDILKYHLHIDPKAFSEATVQDEIINQLGAFFENKIDSCFLVEQFKKETRNRCLVRWVEEAKKQEILAWWHPFARKKKIPRNALFFVADYKRQHPYGHFLGQVLHTVRDMKDEKTRQSYPTGGLEFSLNAYLCGKSGKRRLLRSPRHQFEIQQVIESPQDGCDVYLTIDPIMQAITETALKKGVVQNNAKRGWAILLDPKTGYVLAMAHYPFFDPDSYKDYFNSKELEGSAKAFGIVDTYEPGSIFKPVTLAIAFEANRLRHAIGKEPLFTPEEKIATSDGILPGRARKPLKDTRFYRYMNMDMAVQRSGNIYFARVIDRVINTFGAAWYRKQLVEMFGLGEKTGIELPSESPGVVPTIGKKHPNGTFEWSLSTPYSLAMGHNVQVTALQIARAYGVLANGGKLVTPTIIKKIVTKEGEVVLDNTKPDRIATFPKVLDESIINRVVQSMKYVVKKGGTSKRANVYGYTQVGKTGTGNKVVGGQYSQELYCSSFAGFLPLNDPAFVLLVTIDEPRYGYEALRGRLHHGGTCSGPIYREIAKNVLRYLGIQEDDPYGYPEFDPRYDPEKADWLKEAEALSLLNRSWNE